MAGHEGTSAAHAVSGDKAADAPPAPHERTPTCLESSVGDRHHEADIDPASSTQLPFQAQARVDGPSRPFAASGAASIPPAVDVQVSEPAAVRVNDQPLTARALRALEASRLPESTRLLPPRPGIPAAPTGSRVHRYVRDQQREVNTAEASQQPPVSRPKHSRERHISVDNRPPADPELATPNQRNSEHESLGGHAFISYARRDFHHADKLQLRLEQAGVPVWRDTADLWPGEDWQAKIRQAITNNALAFIACFSRASLARSKSYQNEELTLAIGQLRLRSPGEPWLIPVRFDECDIPDRNIDDVRTLKSIQRVDLFGVHTEENIARLIVSVQGILGRSTDVCP